MLKNKNQKQTRGLINFLETLRDDYMTLFDNTQQQAFQVSMAPNKTEVFAIPRGNVDNILLYIFVILYCNKYCHNKNISSKKHILIGIYLQAINPKV